MRLKRLAVAAVCAATLVVPAAASAQRGGGFHGGGFHGGGFQGGGFHGGGFHGGGFGGYGHGGFYRGGFGYHRFGYGYGGFYPFYGFGFGFGLASLYAYDLAGPWNYYYPASYGAWDYGDGAGDGYGYPDPWGQEAASESSATSAPTAVASPIPCGHYVWNAAQARWHWDDSGC